MKFDLGDGDILLPISKPEFGLDVSWLADYYPHQVGLWIRLEQNFAGGILT
jgi:hypothetical protein